MLHLFLFLSFSCIAGVQSCATTIIVNGLEGPKGQLTIPREEWQELIKLPRVLRGYLRDLLLKESILDQTSLPTAVFKFGRSEIPPVESDEVVLTLIKSADLGFCLKSTHNESDISKSSTTFSLEGSNLVFSLKGYSEVRKYFKLDQNTPCTAVFLNDIFVNCIIYSIASTNIEFSIFFSTGRIPIAYSDKINDFAKQNWEYLVSMRRNRFPITFSLLLCRHLKIPLEEDRLNCFPRNTLRRICVELNRIRLPGDPVLSEEYQETELILKQIMSWVNNV